MIKAGIHGTSTSPQSRDLVRLLLIHPDVNFVGFECAERTGHPLAEDIVDIYGDTQLRYTRNLDVSELDVLFCLDPAAVPQEAIDRLDQDPEFRLIVFPAEDEASVIARDERFIYGVPELNRKAMVRGARAVQLPCAPVVALIDALFPLAKRHLLPETPMQVHVVSTQDAPYHNIPQWREESERCLHAVQTQPRTSVEFELSTQPCDTQRMMEVSVNLMLPQDESTLREAFETEYDDHNFAYLLPAEADLSGHIAPAAGCNKCLITLTPDVDGTTKIVAHIDPRMKGGSGNAIHCMNLLFGLHERTGLALKAGI